MIVGEIRSGAIEHISRIEIVLWLKHGWHVTTVSYVVGFGALLFIAGWYPDAPHKGGIDTSWSASTGRQ